MTAVVVSYLAFVNVVTFILYGLDKFKAKKEMWRIPENSLMTLAVLGGSIGAWIAMKTWHHKTMHKKFRYGLPMIIFIQIAVCIYLLA